MKKSSEKKRKWVPIVTACIVLAGSMTVTAADIDISGLSVEELIQLRTEVDEAIMNKDGAVVIGYGKYEAGVDIAPGQYTLKVYYAEEPDLAGLYYSILTYPAADIDYENAYWAWRRQYDAYEADVEAGKTDTVMPESPNKSEYYVQEQDLIEAPGGSVGISLKEGQTLFLDDWCDNVIITIAKTGTGQGLFMD